MAEELSQRVEIGVQGSDLANVNLVPIYLQRFERAETRRAYQNDLVQFFGQDPITLELARSVTFVAVNRYLSSLEDAGARPATIRRRIAAVRGFFDWLIALGVLETNPAHRQLLRRVRMSRQRDRSIVFLTVDQAQSLLAATELAGNAAIRDRTLILTMLHCVLRRSEAAGMNVEHVRPLGSYWIVDLPETKGGADQYVKIPEHVVREIEAMKAHYGITSGPLWRSISNRNVDGRLSPHSIYRIVHTTARRAGLTETIGAHTLRHTGCTLAIEAGATVQQVQTHARHKQLQTTMMYVHQRDKLRDSAADFITLKGPEDAEMEN